MDKERIRDIIYIIAAIILSILAVKLVIWLLPIIIIALLAYFIYKSMKKNNVSDTWKRKSETKPKTKNKKIIIIDEENND